MTLKVREREYRLRDRTNPEAYDMGVRQTNRQLGTKGEDKEKASSVKKRVNIRYRNCARVPPPPSLTDRRVAVVGK